MNLYSIKILIQKPLRNENCTKEIQYKDGRIVVEDVNGNVIFDSNKKVEEVKIELIKE